jgi:hypothetical protein
MMRFTVCVHHYLIFKMHENEKARFFVNKLHVLEHLKGFAHVLEQIGQVAMTMTLHGLRVNTSREGGYKKTKLRTPAVISPLVKDLARAHRGSMSFAKSNSIEGNKLGKVKQHLQKAMHGTAFVGVLQDLHTKETILREVLQHKLKSRLDRKMRWELVKHKNEGVEKAAVAMQQVVRWYAARRHAKRQIEAAVVLQACMRGVAARKEKQGNVEASAGAKAKGEGN